MHWCKKTEDTCNWLDWTFTKHKGKCFIETILLSWKFSRKCNRFSIMIVNLWFSIVIINLWDFNWMTDERWLRTEVFPYSWPAPFKPEPSPCGHFEKAAYVHTPLVNYGKYPVFINSPVPTSTLIQAWDGEGQLAFSYRSTCSR